MILSQLGEKAGKEEGNPPLSIEGQEGLWLSACHMCSYAQRKKKCQSVKMWKNDDEEFDMSLCLWDFLPQHQLMTMSRTITISSRSVSPNQSETYPDLVTSQSWSKSLLEYCHQCQPRRKYGASIRLCWHHLISRRSKKEFQGRIGHNFWAFMT